jgi:hypothetical protein
MNYVLIGGKYRHKTHLTLHAVPSSLFLSIVACYDVIVEIKLIFELHIVY